MTLNMRSYSFKIIFRYYGNDNRWSVCWEQFLQGKWHNIAENNSTTQWRNFEINSSSGWQLSITLPYHKAEPTKIIQPDVTAYFARLLSNTEIHRSTHMEDKKDIPGKVCGENIALYPPWPNVCIWWMLWRWKTITGNISKHGTYNLFTYFHSVLTCTVRVFYLDAFSRLKLLLVNGRKWISNVVCNMEALLSWSHFVNDSLSNGQSKLNQFCVNNGWRSVEGNYQNLPHTLYVIWP